MHVNDVKGRNTAERLEHGSEQQEQRRHQVTYSAYMYLASGSDCCAHQALNVQMVEPHAKRSVFVLPFVDYVMLT